MIRKLLDSRTLVRFNGEDRQTGEFHYHGYTALLDNVQAAVLDVKLRHLPEWIEHRRTIASYIVRGSKQSRNCVCRISRVQSTSTTYQNYVIRTECRDELREYLKANGVETLVHWRKPMWEHKDLALDNPRLSERKVFCREVISLPMSAETTPQHVEMTVGCIRDFFASRPTSLRTYRSQLRNERSMTLSLSERSCRGFEQAEIRAMSIECEKVGGINLAQGVCDTEVPQAVREEAHTESRTG